MLTVIKRNGRIEKFDLDKIKTSISNCASEGDIMFNQKDLEIIAKDVEKKILTIRGFDSQTSSYEIKAIVLETLHQVGYKKAAEIYCKGCVK